MERHLGKKKLIYLFFLPPCSLELNIIETNVEEIKRKLVRLAVLSGTRHVVLSNKLNFNAVGMYLFINYKPFQK